MKFLPLIALACLLSHPVLCGADAAPAAPALEATPGMKRARNKLKRDFQLPFRKADERQRITAFTPEYVIKEITTNKDFRSLFQVRFWCGENQARIIPALIGLLSSKKTVGLTDSADVIIWKRIQSGDLKFSGHGWVIADDLFTASGRSSWLLKDITGEAHGTIKMGSTDKDRRAVQQKWQEWLRKHSVKAEPRPAENP